MFEYTTDWFSENIPEWEKLLCQPINLALEIGSHEGRSACWILQNKLATNGTLVCIDPWADGLYMGHSMSGVYNRFINNVGLAKQSQQTVVEIRKKSVFGLTDLLNQNYANCFDFIYIDGAHRAIDTITDACMAFQLLKVNGILIFDDYLLKPFGPNTVYKKTAVDAFVNTAKDFCTVINNSKQVAIQKTKTT